MHLRLSSLPLRSALGLALLAGLLSSCARSTRIVQLKISEVGTDKVELFLNDPGPQQLNNVVLTYTKPNGVQGSVDLGALGTNMPANSFLIVWEQRGYQGPPVAQDYPSGQSGVVPGVKVKEDFFGGAGSRPGAVCISGLISQRVTGLLGIFPVVTKFIVDDVVRFGQPASDRPSTCGTFNNGSGSLGNPAGSAPLVRRWQSSGGPQDTDSESDWSRLFGGSWGVRTP